MHISRGHGLACTLLAGKIPLQVGKSQGQEEGGGSPNERALHGEAPARSTKVPFVRRFRPVTTVLQTNTFNRARRVLQCLGFPESFQRNSYTNGAKDF